jgi:hypothetical protein
MRRVGGLGGMDEKRLTPMQIARRKYEERNKEERKAASAQFSTFLPRKSFEEINEFLEKHRITKVDLIYAGFFALKEQREPQNKK